jgi:hypothetical protein
LGPENIFLFNTNIFQGGKLYGMCYGRIEQSLVSVAHAL